MPRIKTPQLHPSILLDRDAHRLARWTCERDAVVPSCALGAIGELVAAHVLGGTVASHVSHGHDLEVGDELVEVKSKTTDGRVRGLSCKNATRLVRVDFRRRRGPIDDEFQLEVTAVRSRPIPASGWRGGWRDEPCGPLLVLRTDSDAADTSVDPTGLDRDPDCRPRTTVARPVGSARRLRAGLVEDAAACRPSSRGGRLLGSNDVQSRPPDQ